MQCRLDKYNDVLYVGALLSPVAADPLSEIHAKKIKGKLNIQWRYAVANFSGHFHMKENHDTYVLLTRAILNIFRVLSSPR